MKITVVGVGAVGGYFGGRLAEFGCDVTFVARGSTLDALRGAGLQIQSPLGDAKIKPVQVAASTAEAGPADVVVLGVKAWQVAGLAASLKPGLASDGFVLPLQNGIEAPDVLISALGQDHAVGGLAKIIAKVEQPGRIVHFGAEPAIVLGELDNRPSLRIEAFRDVLREAGIGATIPGSIQAAMWGKFLFITAMSGLGAAVRAPLGVIREQPESRALVRGVMEEVAAVAAARGVGLDEDVVDRSMAFMDSLSAEGTASMQRDLAEGRPSELEDQTGAVVRLGREVGVPTPINAFLYGVLVPHERAARSGE